MTISLARRQKLAAIAKAHDEWVDENLASAPFDSAGYPKPDSDYNQHYLDVEASGEEEDELATKAAGIFGTPMTAAGDPDWDPKEHPRGPDGKFIESGAVTALKKKISETSVAKNVAYMKDETYKAQSLHEELMKLEQELENVQAQEKAQGVLSPAPKLAAAPKTSGKPITAWTKTIYSGNYADGEIVAVKDDGSARLVWDAETKKFQWQTKSKHAKNSGWITAGQLTKKGAYEKFKNEKTSWLTPVPGATLVDDAPPPVGFDDFPVKASSAQNAILQGDFSSLKQVGAQAGSTTGGFFEAPDGSRWYVKAQKSEKHAKNEALAAALYNVAGVEVPAVIRGKGAPGLPGQNHTATRIIEGANPNLKQKLSDPDYLAKIREGFVVDAWLANWDTAGLVFDNIVEGADGNPKRIDVGGALVFRAMGDEKGSLFGSNVGELETLRNPQMAPTASKVFGGISDSELANSAVKVEAIPPDQIRKLVADYGMDSNVADVLIARREDILSKITPKPKTASPKKVGAKATSPAFTILPEGQRGKSGDGHFAPKIWGKYGAAGVMMRHVDENGVARFLVVKANTMNSKRWQLPGGALEELETPEQGAAREVHEELGFTQEFLHNMTPIGTHKVTIDVPEKGQWSYSNIAVDVPSRPDLTWDEGELGGAKWATAEELVAMSANDEIHPALKANLNQILDKFPSKPVDVPAPAPAPVPEVIPEIAPVPTISQPNVGKKTTWTKGKFTQSVAYKQSYANREIVGVVDMGGGTKRILWENGKFRWYVHESGEGWKYAGTWNTKKAALATLKDLYLYQPPKGTSADENHDFIPAYSIKHGNSTITTQTDLFQEMFDAVPSLVPSASKVTLKPWSEDGKAFASYKSSFTAHSGDQHIGAIHESYDGTWFASGAHGRSKYMPEQDPNATKEQALQAITEANIAYEAANPKLPPLPDSAKPGAVAAKKTPKLTAAQIEKQSGTVPKTLKPHQKTVFLRNFIEDSPFGYIQSVETDMTRVFKALVYAVKKHNETQSPKLNYLQGINIYDQQVYGRDKKSELVTWLKTSEGKLKAPAIASGQVGSDAVKAYSSDATAVKVNKNLATVSSPYLQGKPKKVAAYAFTEITLADAIDMHERMEKAKPLTSDQTQMISNYTDHADPFNKPLRGEGGYSSWQPEDIAELQGAMRPVPDSFIANRNTGGLGAILNSSTSEADIKLLEGAVISDPSFLSTSVGKGSFYNEDKFKLVISVPQGTPAVFAHMYSQHDEEVEMLLAAGLHYRIDSVGPKPGFGPRKVYITVVPEVKDK